MMQSLDQKSPDILNSCHPYRQIKHHEHPSGRPAQVYVVTQRIASFSDALCAVSLIGCEQLSTCSINHLDLVKHWVNQEHLIRLCKVRFPNEVPLFSCQSTSVPLSRDLNPTFKHHTDTGCLQEFEHADTVLHNLSSALSVQDCIQSSNPFTTRT